MRTKIILLVVFGLFVVAVARALSGPTVRAAQRTDGVALKQTAAVRTQYEALVAAAGRAGSSPEGPPGEPQNAQRGGPPRTEPAPPPPNPDPVRFLVEDDEGEPLAGMRARLGLLPGSLANQAYWPALAAATWTSYLDVDPSEAAFEATSDARGALAFVGVPLGRRYRVDLPSQRGFAHTCLLGTTGTRTITIRAAPGHAPLGLHVQGMPPHRGRACLILRRAYGHDLWSPVISQLGAACVVPLTEDGQAETPLLPEGPLVADVVVPDVGVWRGCTVERTAEGTARVSLGAGNTMTLRGTLSDPNGKGVRGADLTLAVKSFLKTRPSRAWLRRAISDRDGRFEFRDVPVGVVKELHILAAGFVAPRLVLEDAPLLPGETLDVPVQVVPGCSVVGVATDATGTPLARMKVRPNGDAGMALWDPGTTWTDEDGRYRVDGLPPGEVTLRVSGRGDLGRTEVRAVARHGLVVHAPQAVVPIRSKGGRIAVQVLDTQGRPVSGAGVAHRVRHGNMSGTDHTGRTGPDGSHVIRGVDARAEQIEIWAHKKGAASTAQSVPPADAKAGTAQVVLVLPAAGQIHGMVSCKGVPAPNVTVAVESTRHKAVTDHKGHFRIRGVPAGDWRVHARSGNGAILGEPVRARVVDGGKTEVELIVPAAQRGALLRGRLVDRQGVPLAGVSLSTGEQHFQYAGAVARTGRDGRFELPVPRRDDYSLFSGKRPISRALSAGLDSVDVVFDPRDVAVVQGRVLDEHGDQAYALHVSVAVGGSGRYSEVHGSGGFFRMGLAPHMVAGLTVQADHGYRDRLGREVLYRIDPVSFEPGGSVALRRRAPKPKRPASGRALSGFVVDEAGHAIEGSIVWWQERPNTYHSDKSTRSAADGTFVLRNLPPGPLHLMVHGDGPFAFNREPITVDPDGGPIRITLARTPASEMYTVRGRVLDLDDRPVPDVPLELWDEGLAGRRHTRSDTEGRFLFQHVRRQPARVEVDSFWEAPEYALRHLELEVEVGPASGETVIRIPAHHLESDKVHDVRIALADPEGALIPETGPFVRLVGLGDLDGVEHRPRPFERGEKDGRFVLRGVGPGRYRLEVTFSGIDPSYLPVEPMEVEVPAGSVVIPVRRAAELHGRVEGDDLEGYWVFAWSDGGRRYLGRTISSSGAFAFRVPPDGTFTLEAHHPDRVPFGLLTDAKPAGSPHRLRLDRKGLEIAGRLEGYEQTPEDYTLTVKGSLYTQALRLDDEGRFRVRGLPPGSYAVRFRDNDWSNRGREDPIEVTVEAGQTDVVLRRKTAK